MRKLKYLKNFIVIIYWKILEKNIHKKYWQTSNFILIKGIFENLKKKLKKKEKL